MKTLLFILSILICMTSIAQNKKSFLRDGNISYLDSSYNEAEIQYRKSLEKDQDYFNASFNLADAIYKQKRYTEASAIFKALINDAPNTNTLMQVYHNLGNSLFQEQKLEEAINAYKDALRINPHDNETRHNLALAKEQKDNKQKEENQEQKEENQEQKEEKQEQKEENQEQKEENQEQKEEKKEQKEEKKEQKEEKKEDISKEAAEKMLEAIERKEEELQKELQKKKAKGKKVKVLKDW